MDRYFAIFRARTLMLDCAGVIWQIREQDDQRY